MNAAESATAYAWAQARLYDYVERLEAGAAELRRENVALQAELDYWHSFRAYKRERGRLPLRPFQLWLQDRVQELGYAGVAAAAGMNLSDRRVRTWVTGMTYQKAGQTYQHWWVQVDVVDRVAAALGYHISDIYPNE